MKKKQPFFSPELNILLENVWVILVKIFFMGSFVKNASV